MVPAGSDAEVLRSSRPDDVTVSPRDTVTADHVHVVLVGAQDAERAAFASLDLAVTSPWVVVVDSRTDEDVTRTIGIEQPLLAAGYRVTLVDGVSRFHVAPGHDDVARALSWPACARDEFVDGRHLAEVKDLADQLGHWRARAVHGWSFWEPPPLIEGSDADHRLVEDLTRQLTDAHLQLTRMHETLSWRITAPLRAVRRGLGST